VDIFDQDESYYPDSIYKFIMGSGWRTEEQHDIPWTIRESIRFLENRDFEKPFFLFTSIFGPHQPYLAPAPWDSLYSANDIVLGPRFSAKMESSPIFKMKHGRLSGKLHSEWGPEKFKKVIAAYYGQISMIDHYLGQLFNYLREKRLWEDTWIIFLADHGDFNGAYGTFFKGEMYDVSVKIPLIIKPAQGNWIHGIREELINSIDLYGTLLEISGDRTWKDLPQMESQSLIPLLRADTSITWENKVFSIIGNSPDQNLTMIRSGSLKLIRQAVRDKEPLYELYDLDKDPYETQNVYGKPLYYDLEEELRAELDKWWQLQSSRYPEKLDHSFKRQ
jgi:arylsulfatase A-like enzyme